MAAKTLDLGNEESDFVAYTRTQIDYLLGKNEEGISYVIGYSNNYPMKPHHRARYVTVFFLDIVMKSKQCSLNLK